MTVEEKYVENVAVVKDAADWSGSPLLPPGWMFKQEVKELRFISQKGTLVNRLEVEMLFKFKPKKARKRVKEKALLPEGWIGKDVKVEANNIRIKTKRERQSGHKISKEKKSGEETKGKSKSWKTNEFLPGGWMSKETKTGIRVKTDNGRVFKSYKLAAKVMKSLDKYTNKDVESLYLYPNGGIVKQNRVKEGWSTNKYLPEGWMGKKTVVKEGKTGGSITHFKTETGKRLSTYKATVSFMESSGK